MQIKTEIGDNALEVLVEFDYTPGRKAKLTGPMEDSYPAEPAELDMYSVQITKIGGQPAMDVLGGSQIVDILGDATLELLRQRCLDHVESTEPEPGAAVKVKRHSWEWPTPIR